MSNSGAMHRRAALALAAALGCLGLAGCSGGNSRGAVSSASSAISSTTASGDLGSAAARRFPLDFDASGKVSKSAALAAASAAFGPIDGIAKPATNSTPFFSGSGPYRWIAGVWDELSRDQREAVLRRLGETAAPAAASSTLPGASRMRSARRLDDPGTEVYRQLVDWSVNAIAKNLGRPLSLPTELHLSAAASSDGAYAHAARWALGGAPFPACRITFFPKAASAGADLTFLVAHEVFHCFQYDVLTYAQWSVAPAWVIEGQASWAGLEVAGAAEVMTDATQPGNLDHWRGWLEDPGTPLYKRAYDAVGFYTVLKDLGTDVWRVLDGMLSAGGGLAPYQSATAGIDDAVAKRWTSPLFRANTPCCAWDLRTAVGPTAATSAIPPVHTLGVDNSATVATDQIAALAGGLYLLDLRADIVSVTTTGYSRLADASTVDLAPTPGATVDLCARSGGCRCPDGEDRAPLTTVTGPLRWAVGGGQAVALGQAIGVSLDEWCRRRPPPTTIPAGPIDACGLLSAEEVRAATGYSLPPRVGSGISALASCGWAEGPNPPVWAVQLQTVDPPLKALPAPAIAQLDCVAFSGSYIDGSGWYACVPDAGQGIFVRTLRGAAILTTTEPLNAAQGRALATIMVRHLLSR